MKANHLVVLLLFLMLGVAVAQQSNSVSGFKNNDAFLELKARAEKGDSDAQCQLGLMYDNGQETETNYVEAVKWYRKASEQGDFIAQYNLGCHFATGRGVNQDDVESVKWWLKAARLGYAIAQNSVGSAYEIGQGVSRNYTESAKWYLRAAKQGNLDAEMKLGGFYATAVGVTHIEAYKWSSLAAAHTGKTEREKILIAASLKQRDLLASEMLPAEIAEANRLISSFVPIDEIPNIDANLNSPVASGSGFFITDDGFLVTNFHVVDGAKNIRLLTTTGTVAARVIRLDAANDLALLKASTKILSTFGAEFSDESNGGKPNRANFSSLPISASRTVKLGATVATVGFPDPGLQGFHPKLAKGEIGSLAGASDDPRYFQISVPVQPGNSGGALVDARGNVVGIVAAKLDAAAALAATGSLPENVNYAVKSSLLLSFLESVPDVAAKLKEPNAKDESFEEVVKSAQAAAVLVLVY